MEKVRILFSPDVESGNTNAQSLTTREIALRLDPGRFQLSLWYEHDPDARLQNRANIRLLKLPAHGKTIRILREMLSGYDMIAYMDYSPATYLFLHLPPSLRSRTKMVYHVEAPAAQMENPARTLRFLYNGTVRRCDAYTGVTEFVARDIGNLVGKKVNYIFPLGVDTKMFTPPERRQNASPVVLFVGTLIARKGPQYLIDAAVRFPGAIFRLVGSGRGGFDEVLRQRISELRLQNIRLEGPKSQTEILKIMRESDIFVLPSRLEGLPKVTLEAAATGLPCIVFRDYETPSVIDGVTGFQVTTVDEMMAALEKLIGDSNLRQTMGAAAREHVKGFDWDLVSAIWQRTYLEIAAGNLR